MLTLHGGFYLTIDVGIFSPAMLSYLPLLWHPGDPRPRILYWPRWRARVDALAVVALIYVMGVRLSRDLQVWPERPQLPLPQSMNTVTRVLGILQPWMMFAPEPPRYTVVIVTDAVTSTEHHFDPWNAAATGNAKPVRELRASLGRADEYNTFDNYLARDADSRLHPFFARWVLRQRDNSDQVERFGAWLLAVPTAPREVVPAERLDERVGVLQPKHSAGFQNTLSEVAVFDHPVSLPAAPALPERSSEAFFAALQRPGVMGVVSGSNHPDPDCPAESPRVP